MKSPQHFINNKHLENGYKIIWIIKCCHMLFKILEYLLKCDKLYFFKFNPRKREIIEHGHLQAYSDYTKS